MVAIMSGGNEVLSAIERELRRSNEIANDCEHIEFGTTNTEAIIKLNRNQK